MKIKKNVPLAKFSSYKIGGPASNFLEISNIDQLQGLNPEAFAKFFVLGGGTNILISDEGFEGLVIKMGIGDLKLKENELEAGAGVLISDILNFCIENSLSGLEWAGGLPGTIGGAARGNAGAFKGEIKDSVYEVESMDLFTKKLTRRNNKECEFGYRWSIFKTNPNEFITTVILKLTKGEKSEIKKSINEKIEYRNLKHPLDYPNIGSTFKNIPLSSLPRKLKEEFWPYIKNDPFPIVPTAKLLALADLKGTRVGDAMISDKHPNFIVNVGNAKSSDVLELIKIAKRTIKNKWGIELEEEIMYL